MARTLVRLAFAGAVLGVGGAVYWRYQKRKERNEGLERRRQIRKKREVQENSREAALARSLGSYLQTGATLATPIHDGLTYASRFVTPSESVGLTPRTQMRVFASAQRLADAGETEDMDQAVRTILREVMPDCGWDETQWPLEEGSSRDMAYRAVEELLQLAALDLRYEEFHKFDRNSSVYGAGFVCPGWNHAAPAPVVGLRPHDLVEIMLGAEDKDGNDVYSEPAWVIVNTMDGNRVFGVLAGPGVEIRPGIPVPTIRGTDKHGYSAGQDVEFDRRCVYSVRRARG